MTTEYSDHLVIGMDVGGTGLKAAVIDRQGRVFIKEQRPTQRERGSEAVIASILDFAYDLAKSTSSPSGAGRRQSGARARSRGPARRRRR